MHSPNPLLYVQTELPLAGASGVGRTSMINDPTPIHPVTMTMGIIRKCEFQTR
jgi:putative ribosome biogenesis GTPase RsgA